MMLWNGQATRLRPLGDPGQADHGYRGSNLPHRVINPGYILVITLTAHPSSQRTVVNHA